VSSAEPKELSLTTRLVQFVGAVVALWAILAGPAYFLAQYDGIEGLTYAALLCLTPGLIVMAIASRVREAGQQAMVAILGGMLLRLVFVLVGVVTIQTSRPHLKLREFIIWLLVFYMATIAIETRMVVASVKASQPKPTDVNN
jgi:hypothetical protein